MKHKWRTVGIEIVKGALAASLLAGALSGTISVVLETAAAAAGPKILHTQIGVAAVSPAKAAVAATGTTTTAPVSDFYRVVPTLITGGAAAVAYKSLKIVTPPPVADGTATVTIATANQGFIKMTPSTTTAAPFQLTFGICNVGTTVFTTATVPAKCSKGTMHYDITHTQAIGETVTVTGLAKASIVQTPSIATTVQPTQGAGLVATPTLVTKGSTFALQAAAPATHIPTAAAGHTLVTASKVRAIFPVPANLTITAASIKAFGGSAQTAGVATSTYCTAAIATVCTALHAGNYKTPATYIEEELKTSVKITKGKNFTLPSSYMKMKATGAVNSVGTMTMTEFGITIHVNVFGTRTAHFDGYPSHKGATAGTPTPTPYTPPTPLAYVKIVGGTVTGATPGFGLTTGLYPVTIKGTHLTTVTPAKVTWAGALIPAATILTIKATEVVIKKVPAHAPGKISVTLGIATGTKWHGATIFTYGATSHITSLTPSKGKTAGNTGTVTIHGLHFLTDVTKVTFGGVVIPAATFTAIFATRIVLKKNPAHVTPGTVNVKVTSPEFGTSNAAIYRYYAPPTITSFVKTAGPIAGGVQVTIFGTNLTTGTIQFGVTAPFSYTDTAKTHIKAFTTKPHAPGTFTITVTTPGGTFTTVAKYDFVGLPKITGISPTQGPVAGGTPVVITGTNFTAHTLKVTFGAVAGVTPTMTGTKIKVISPAHTPGPVPVKVTDAGGTTSKTPGFKFIPLPPTITTVTPSKGTTGGGTPVVIHGAHFVATTLVVTFAGTIVAATYTASTHTVKVNTPSHNPGHVAVKITDSGGSNTKASAYQYTPPAPTISSVTPGKGTTGGGTPVVIHGSNFIATTLVVTFAGTVVPATYTATTHTILVTTPSHTAGHVAVKVTDSGGSNTKASAYQYLPPAPTIATVAPPKGPTGGNTTVVINGTHFIATTLVVTFGGNIIAVPVVTGTTKIKFKSPSHIPGHVAVKVTDSGGTNTKASAYQYTPPAPTISSVTPGKGTTGGGTPVVIHGSNFIATTLVVTFAGTVVPATYTATTHTILVTTPSHTAGHVAVKVTDSGGSNTKASAYQYLPPAPTIATVAPPKGPTGGNTTVVINGTHFVATTLVVTFGGNIIAVPVVTGTTKIKFKSPSHIPGHVAVKVTDSGGTFTQASAYLYTPPAPTISSVTPGKGTTGGGTPVVIHGTNFIATTLVVTFAGTVVPATYTATTHTILVTTPSHTAGHVAVKVTDSGGSNTKASAYQYLPPAPTIATVTINHGSTAGGTSVVIHGTNFVATTLVVTFAGTIVSATYTATTHSILVTTPSHGPGHVAVKVTDSGGNNTKPSAYQYIPPAPTVGVISPTRGPHTGGTVVTIHGTNFAQTTLVVTFGGSPGTTPVFTGGAKTITVTTTAHTPGRITVIVTDSGGTKTKPLGFQFNTTTPTISSITPTNGSTGGGTTVSISGLYLVSTTLSVTFGGTLGTGASITAGNVKVKSPIHAAGHVIVKVHDSGGTVQKATGFQFIPPAPTVTSVTAATGPIAGLVTVTVNGANFAQTTLTVTFGGTLGTAATVTGTTKIKVKTPAHPAGHVAVKVHDSGGTTTKASAYQFVPPAPTITTVTLPTGPVAGLVTVTVNGANFAQTTLTVTFGGTLGTAATVTGTTKIHVKTPAHTPARVAVKVHDSGGTTTKTSAYQFVPLPPTISTVTINHGPTGGGTSVVIHGTNFIGTTLVVTFGGGVIPATYTATTHTILVTTVSHAPGRVSVKVHDSGGTTTKTSAYQFVPPAPVIGVIAPIRGPHTGGTAVVIHGTNFTQTTLVVTFGGSLGSTPVYTAAQKKITVTTTAHTPGHVTVTVTDSGGTKTKPLGFQFNSTTPTITSIVPTNGPTSGGTTVVISGLHLVVTTLTVTFGGTPGITPTITGGKVKVHTPTHLAGHVTVTVADSGGTVSKATGFQFVPPAPTVSTVTLSSGPIAGLVTVTVNGANFAQTTLTVTFGGTLGTAATVTGTTKIKVKTPAHPAGHVAVKVHDSGGSKTKLSAYQFIPPAPTVTSVAAPTGPIAGLVTVTVNGANFAQTTLTVTFGGTLGTAATVTGTTKIKVKTPAHAAGHVAVKVHDSGGTKTKASAYQFVPPAPTITTVTAATGPIAGLVTVTVNGANFAQTTLTVTFGGTLGTAATVTGTTKIKVKTPAHPAGHVAVKVHDSGGTTTKASAYQFVPPAPTITTVTAATGPIAGLVTVTVNGANFAQTTLTVTFGGTLGTAATVTGTTKIKVKTPAHPAGHVAVKVHDSGGTTTKASAYQFVPPAPTITTVTLPTGPVAGLVTVTVNGANFAQTTLTVTFGGTLGTAATVTGTTKIHVKTPAHTPARVAVKVHDSGGTTTKTSAYQFVPPAPVIGVIAPIRGPHTGGTAVVIHGTNFTQTTLVVTFGGSLGSTPVYTAAQKKITVTTTAHTPGHVTVTVTDSGGTKTKPLGFQFNSTTPTITSIVPTNGPTGGGTTVVISGLHLVVTTLTVTFGGTPGITPTITGGKVKVHTPTHLAGHVTVTVADSGGTVSKATGFQFVPPAPTVSTVTLSSGPIAGLVTVTVNGANFAQTTLTVTFGGTLGTAATVTGTTKIKVKTPAHPAGHVAVKVHDSGGSKTKLSAYQFIPPAPTVTSVAAPTGPIAGLVTVTVNGANFAQTTLTVTFGGTLGTAATVTGTTKIKVKTPAHAAGHVAVKVHDSGGTKTKASAYQFVPPAPTITTVTAATGPIAGLVTVTVNGANFAQTTLTVTFGGTLGTAATVTGTTKIKVKTPAHPAGHVAVKVHDSGGTTTKASAYQFVPPAPTITTVTAATGPIAGLVTVTVNGANFAQTTLTVTFGGTLGTAATVTGTTKIKVKTPAHPAGHVAVKVHDSGGTTTKASAYQFVPPAPTITTVTLPTGPVAGLVTVTVNGANFAQTTLTVTFGGTLGTAATVTGTTKIHVKTPAHTPARVAVKVHDSGGTTTKTSAYQFVPPAPVIGVIAPIRGPHTGGTAVVIHGTNFTQTTLVVTFGGSLGSTPVYTAAQKKITVTTTAHTPGHVTVTVTDSGGTKTKPLGFQFNSTTPTITSIVPTNGPTGGGTTVVISGLHLVVTTLTVTFGGTPGITPTITGGKVKVHTPTHLAGHVTVTVADSGGTVSKATGFQFVPPAPTVSTVTLSSGPIAGLVTVTVNGANFAQTTLTVTFGGTLGTAATVTGTTKIKVKTPAHPAGHVAVKVHDSGGSKTKLSAYQFIPPAPTVTSVAAPTGPIAGLVTVTVNGANFAQTTLTVTFGGTLGTAATVTGTTKIKVKTPAHAAGHVAVKVHDSGGTKTKASAYQFVPPAPTITTVTAATGPIAGLVTVTVNGANFAQTTLTVTFGGTLGTAATVTGTTKIKVKTPAHPAGHVAVKVHDSGGTTTKASAYQFVPPAPTITTVTAATGPIAGLVTVTVNGANFAQTTLTVTFGGTLGTAATVTGTTKIKVKTPAHPAGHVAVKVHDSGGTTTKASAYQFVPPAPTITTVTLPTGPVAGLVTVTVNGANFAQTTLTVTFGGTLGTAATVTGTTKIHVKTPAHAPGHVAVKVHDSGGTKTKSSAYQFVPPGPTIGSIVPTHGPIAGGTVVVIHGTNFTQTTLVVTFGGKPGSSPIYTAGAKTITVTNPSHTGGKVAVTVTDSGGPGTKATGFKYIPPAPTISTITPSSGSTQGGTTVTIHGTNFVGTTLVVTFGGATGKTAHYTAVTKTIKVKTPPHTIGKVTVTVTDSGGTKTKPTAFKFKGTIPTITSIVPASGPISGGTTVLISGTHLVATTLHVTFGSTPGTSPTITGGRIKVTTPSHAAGKVTVTVTDSGGTVPKTTGFKYIPLTPTISTVTPTHGPTTGGTVVTITGANLIGTTLSVIFGGLPGKTPAYTATTKVVTVDSPIHAAGKVSVTLTDSGGTVAKATGFKFIPPAPSITGIAPSSGPTAGGTSVTISGSNFTGTTLKVTFGSTPGVSPTYTAGAKTVKVTTASHTAGKVTVTVTDSGGTNAKATGFKFIPPAPSITGVAPPSGPTGGGTAVVISGTNFTGTTLAVTFGGTPGVAPTYTAIAKTIKVKTPAHTAGHVAVTVTDSGGTNAKTTGFKFIPPTPVITAVAPTHGPTTGGTKVTISGSNFAATTMVITFGSTVAPSFSVPNSSTIKVTTPGHTAGKVTVTVSDSGGSTTKANGYKFIPPAPVITAVAPTHGPTAGNTSVVISGTNLVATTLAVTFGGNPGVTPTYTAGAKTIKVKTPAHTAGKVAVTVTDSGGSNAKTTGFKFIPPAPTVSSIVPTSGPTAGGTSVVITGTNFTATTLKVTFGGVAGISPTVTGATTIFVTSPAHTAAKVNLKVTDSGGSTTKTPGFKFIPPAPKITSIAPSSGPTAGGTAVVIHGTNFASTTLAVTFGGSAGKTPTYTAGAKTVTVSTPAHTAAKVKVTVTDSGGSVAKATGFKFVPPAPSITSIAPASGSTAGGTVVTIHGTNLAGTTLVVTFGGTAGKTVTYTAGAKTVSAKTPAHTAAKVTVTLTDSGGTVAKATGFKFIPPAPSITGIAPSSGPTAGGTSVTISGSNFTGTTLKVTFGSTPGVSPTYTAGAKTVKVTTASHTAGKVAVTVSDSGGSATKATGFKFIPPAPSITGVAPPSGPTGGGTAVVISGTNFTGTTLAVTFGGTPGVAPTYTAIAKTIKVKTPAHTAGHVAVTVTDSGGTNAKTTGFKFIPPTPVITAVAPTHGPTTGGTKVTISGSNFAATTMVITFGSTVAPSFSVPNSSTIKVTTPGHTAGKVTVTVSDSGGSTTKANGYKFIPPAPVITAVAPTHGPTAGNTSVVISGTNLVATTLAVTFGGNPGVTPTYTAGAKTVKVKTPAHTAGKVAVTVTDSGGSNAKTTGFKFIPPAPTVSSIVPTSGPTAGGTSVVITGTNFTATTLKVTFGGVAGISPTVTGATTIFVTSPAHGAGHVAVKVSDSGGSKTKTPGFKFIPPAPKITSIAPSSGPTAGGTAVVIHGTNFASTTLKITFGGSLGTAATVTGTSTIFVTSPAHTAAKVKVTVTDSGGSVAKATGFKFVPPAPTITSIAPASGSTAGGTVVTIHGTNLAGTTLVVTFGGTAGKTVTYTAGAKTVSAKTPAHTAAKVTVTLTDSGGTVAKATGFKFIPPAPSITGIAPSSGPTAGGTSVTISGSNFTGTTLKVTFGSTPGVSPTYTAGAKTVKVTTASHTAGKVTVTVTDSGGTNAKATGFKFIPPAPSITGVAPPSGPTGGGTAVVISGTNFTGTTLAVTFGGTPGVAPTYTAIAKTIKVKTPAHTAGHVAVTVTDSGGTNAKTTGFKFIPPTPVITAVAPTHGPTTGGTKVTISGSNFAATTMVITFGSTVAPSFSVPNSSTIKVTTPGHTAGKVTVTVSDSGGSTTKANGYKFIPPAPVITAVAPTHGPTAGNTSVVISGTNLVATTLAVTFGGNPGVTPTYTAGAKTVKVKTPAHTAGKVAVTVTDSGGSNAKTTGFKFIPPAPTVSSIVPTSGPTAGGTSVVITGTNFTATTLKVTFGGVAGISPTVTGATTIFVTSPAHTAAKVNLKVTDSGGSTTKTPGFKFIPPAPKITSIAPSSGPTAGGTAVVIHGTNFASTTLAVTFGGSAGKTPTYTAGAKTVTVSTPAHTAAKVKVTVTDSGGSVAKATGFKFVPPAPSITSIAPASGSTAGGTVVTITGSNFTSTTLVVTFGGTAGRTVTYTALTKSIKVTTPTHTAAKVKVTVSDSGGSGAKVTGFKFIPPAPSITGVAPASGPTAGGTSVTITGSNFTATTLKITFGSTSAVTYTVLLSTSIKVTSPAHTAGKVSVTVSDSGGSATKATSFKFIPPAPSITSSTPTHGSTTGGTVVTISGSNLVGTTLSVFFGAVAGKTPTFTSTFKTITVTAPAHGPGKVGVSVTDSGGSFTKATGFRYIPPAPKITGIAPTHGPTAGGTPVVITGSNFAQTTLKVTFGGTLGTTPVVTNTSTITVISPAHTAGKVTVTVSDSGGSITKANGFKFIPPAPVITSVAPTHGTTAGGTSVTISGANLVATTLKVTFGGNPGVTLTYTAGAKTIKVKTPAHLAGKVTVTVTDSGGSIAKATGFKFVPATPTVSSVVPSSGPIAGGTSVVITGTNFAQTTLAVTFGGILGTSPTVTGTTTITVTSPAHTAARVPVIVTDSGGLVTKTPGFQFIPPAPKITGVAPSSGPTAGGTSVVIHGTNFTQTTLVVTFGGTAGKTPICTAGAKTVTISTPAHVAASVKVTVSDSGGSVAKATGFKFLPPAPSITGVAPSSGPITGSTVVFISGLNLVATTLKVTFGSTAGIAPAITGAKIKVTTQAHAAGKVAVTVSDSGGTIAKATGFKFIPPAPTITSISPVSGPTAGGTAVVIHGTNFTGTTLTVTFGGVLGTAPTVTGTTAVMVNSPAHVAGHVTVTVTDSGGPVAMATGFKFIPPAPSITGVAPASGPTAGGTSVLISGANLVATTLKVTFGSTAGIAPTMTGAKIKVTTPAHAAAKVTVTVSDSGGSIAKPTGFKFIPPVPTLSSVTPSAGPTAGGTVVTLHGTNFTGTTLKVTFGGVLGTSPTFTATTKIITVTSPIHGSGKATVSITDSGGTVAKVAGFTFIPPAPSITSVAPTVAPTAGGTPILITGTNFVATTLVVTIGGVICATATWTSSTTIKVTTPPEASGTASVTVTDLGGTVTQKTAITFVPAPVVTKFTRGSVPASGTVVIVLSGSNFTGATSVTIGGIPVKSYTVKSGTTIDIVVQAHPAGTTTVAVTTVGGTATKKTAITFVAAPVVTKFTRGSVPASGTVLVVLSGSNFTGATSVTIGGIPVKSYTVKSGTTIDIVLQAHTAGTTTVAVTTVGGTATKKTAITFVAAPVVTKVTPGSVPTTGTVKVTVSGTFLTGATAVTVGGVPVKTFTITGSTTITFVVPAHTAGSTTVAVTTVGGTSTKKTGITFVAAPTIRTITPGSVSSSGTVKITINGTNFTGTTAVTVGGVPVKTFKVTNSSTITVVVSGHSAGTTTVTVVTAGGTVTKKTVLTFLGPGGVPSAPPNVTAAGEDHQVKLTWTVPADNGSAITSFVIVPFKNGIAQAPIAVKISSTDAATPGTSDTYLVTSITNAPVTYTFTVAATNGIGTGPSTTSGPVQGHSGFWLTAADGGVFSFGSAAFYGSMGGKHLNKPIVGIAPTVDNGGYWLVASDGGIFSFGDARFHGSMGNKHLNKPVVGMAAMPTGKGYWMVASDGGIFSFGTAKFFGSTGNRHLVKPIAAMAVMPTGKGYWMVASDGGVFSFGSAKFHGSMGGKALIAPIVGISGTRDGKGYWLLTQDGGVIPFGDAQSLGSLTGSSLTSPLTGIATSVDGVGYWITQANGVVHSYGDAETFKAIGHALNSPVVAMAPMS